MNEVILGPGGPWNVEAVGTLTFTPSCYTAKSGSCPLCYKHISKNKA